MTCCKSVANCARNAPAAGRQLPGQGADVQPHPPGDGRTDLPGVQHFTLDFTGFKNILSQDLQGGLLTQREAEGFHAAQQPPLQVAHFGQGFSQPGLIPNKVRPFVALVNIHDNLRKI